MSMVRSLRKLKEKKEEQEQRQEASVIPVSNIERIQFDSRSTEVSLGGPGRLRMTN